MHMVHLLAAISGLVGAFSAFGTLLSQWLEDDLLIPGGSGLKHCDDPGNRHDPETELVTFNRILVEPNPPIVGHNLTLTAFGRFEADFSHHASNLSLTYFVNAADAMFSWDTMSFCNATTNVLQTVDGVLRESCPPVEGSAVLISKFYLEKWWPAGKWYVNIHARNGTNGEDPKLFCVEGRVNVRPWRTREWFQSLWSWKSDI